MQYMAQMWSISALIKITERSMLNILLTITQNPENAIE